MCDDRETLIAYLYDEATAAERRQVDAHLATCADCREELRSLRGVRQDLLAWDVPAHESVWKPFAAPQPVVWWRQVPAWGLAAAATLVFGVGLAGGYVAAAPIKAAAAAQLAQTQQAPNADAVRALEQRLASVEQAAARQTASAAPVSLTREAPAGLTRAEVENLLRDTEGRINERTARKLVSILLDMEKARARDMAAVTQQISGVQATTNENLLRVMTARTPDKDKE